MRILFLADVFCVLLLYYVSADTGQTFNNPSPGPFNHLAIDSHTGYVYVAADNAIYKLSQDLVLEQSVITSTDKKLTNVNKALLVDYNKNRLIACGSAQGFCSTHSLRNISDVRQVQEPVVATGSEASTVAFIAEGPGKKQMMYVGAAHTVDSHVVLPAVSSRSLEDDHLFTIDQPGTKMFVNSLSRDQYPVDYVYGFSSEGFSYFVTTQSTAVGSGTYYSKLIRVCHNDENYYSYTEIPITCKGEGIDFNLAQAAFIGKAGLLLAKKLGINVQQDVLYAAFSTSDTKNPNKPTETSALCIYPISEIRRKFAQNIQSCFKGHGARGLDFITPSAPCIPTKLNIDENFCGLDLNTPLGGEDAVEAVPVITISDRASALAVQSSYYTVVIIGTSTGHITKVLVDGATASKFSDVIVDQDIPIKKIFANSLHTDLFVMTKHKLSKVKIQQCSVHKSCSECLDTKDPYCGWCPSENKCSAQSDCPDAVRGHTNWRQRITPYRNDTCAVITKVKPKQLQRTKSATLKVHINNLPPGDTFFCVFRFVGRSLTTVAKRQSYGLDCDSPPVNSLPHISEGRHRLKGWLYVRDGQQNDLASTNYIFYDCSSYGSCTECASSQYHCDWCIDGNQCTHDGAAYCRNDLLVTHNSSKHQHTNSCPAFFSKTDTNEILIPSGVKKAIAVKAQLTGSFVIQSRFLCEFIITGQKFHVNAQLLGDTIYCDSFEFSYNTSKPHVTASFNILWAGGSKKLDNPDNIHLVIYRCNLVEDCGTCLTMPEKYQCGWCQGADKCELQHSCGIPNTWFSQNHVCPNPKIHSFKPKLGPWEGGTLITIEGINLGRQASDIKDVVIAGVPCEPVPELYVTTKQIVCRTVGPGDDKLRTGLISVRIGEYYAEAPNTTYSFVNPVIDSIKPKYGPLSGGTSVQISGKYLNAGSDTKVYINDMPCNIVGIENEVIVCKTSRSREPRNSTVRVSFDNVMRFLNNGTFEYVEDPVIISVDSGLSSSYKQPKGTPSGGTNIKVLGRNFHGIQVPYIHVYYNTETFSRRCVKVDYDTQLLCKSPKILTEVPLDPQSPLELEYGFHMDGVKNVRKLKNKLGAYLLYPDPVFEKFEGIKNLSGDYLTINGDNLDWAYTSEEISVRIGDDLSRVKCQMTSLSRHQVTCRLPELNELPNDVDEYDVVVTIGGKDTWIGKISYTQKRKKLQN